MSVRLKRYRIDDFAQLRSPLAGADGHRRETSWPEGQSAVLATSELPVVNAHYAEQNQISPLSGEPAAIAARRAHYLARLFPLEPRLEVRHQVAADGRQAHIAREKCSYGALLP
jgi:hypothetical protein